MAFDFVGTQPDDQESYAQKLLRGLFPGAPPQQGGFNERIAASAPMPQPTAPAATPPPAMPAPDMPKLGSQPAPTAILGSTPQPPPPQAPQPPPPAHVGLGRKLALVGLGALGGPQAAQTAVQSYEGLRNAPIDAFNRQQAAAKEDLQNQDTQAQMQQRAALAQKALNPTPAKPENVQQVYSDAIQDAIDRGVDPNSDPRVLQIADSITRLQKETAPKPGDQPLTPAQAQTYNQQMTDRWQVLNPNKPLPTEYALNPNSTVGDYQRADTALKSLESAVGTQSQRDNATAARTAATAAKPDVRLDRSYQFNAGQLDKERTPVEAEMGKISTALTNINLQSPQADALLAPEVLSLSAGGSGSGLRMNQAELERITGGRTQWESLKAALNKWSTDPNHPQIPAEQRAQMQAIVNAAQQKGALKQQILEQAEQELNDATDVKAHRQVVVNARKLLDSVDSGARLQRNKSTGEFRVAQ